MLQVTFLYWRIVDLEAGKDDLRQRLEDRDQAHAWIQAKLQVTFLILEDCRPGGR
jgi:hypothetical protein